MGMYINYDSKGNPLGQSFNEKITALIADGAEPHRSPEFVENIVCVVDNGYFAAAAYAFDEREYRDFMYPCGRRKVWLVYPHAKLLAK